MAIVKLFAMIDLFNDGIVYPAPRAKAKGEVDDVVGDALHAVNISFNFGNTPQGKPRSAVRGAKGALVPGAITGNP